MRNLKTILPMLAFVLAIGMSFAFVGATEENYYATKYVLLDPSDDTNPDSWATIEVECGNGQQECTVEYLSYGVSFAVYNTPDINDRAESDTGKVQNEGPPPTLN